MDLDVNKLNFDRCENERIHIPESIQGYGYLFAIDRSNYDIRIISANTKNIFGDRELIGTSFFDLLKGDSEERIFLEATFSRVSTSKIRLPIQIAFEPTLLARYKDSGYFAVVYTSGPYFVVELEPSTEFRERYTADQYVKLYAMSVAPRFKTLTSLGEMAHQMVETIRYLTNMDRVVLYKFNEDQSGQVIAEAKDKDLESYMDLYFPASDIPPQARELYKVNWVRLTPDADLPSSPLLPKMSEVSREPLDMTHSLLRTLSPIHLQYIRNQGLKASFSISLVTGDNLYGLISCHSKTARYITQDVRLQCENLSQLFSWHLLAKEEELLTKKQVATETAVDGMLDLIGPANPIVNVVRNGESAFLQAMNCDGFIYYSQHETITLGHTLPIELVKELYTEASANQSLPYVNESLIERFAEDELNGIAGIMLISLFEQKKYFTAWFRKEHVSIQRWSGVENEKSENASKKERLTPRVSFKVNTRKITGRSKIFDKTDLSIANRLNRMFLVHALDAQDRMHTSLTNLRKQDQYRNEFLATLAHELRNPLSPITSGVNLLETSQDQSVRKKVINIIKRQSEYMTKLVNDLMDVSRITQGKIKIKFERLNLENVISHSLEIIAQSIEEKNHYVRINNPSETLFVSGDQARLSQIFSNVLHNAVKYTEPNGQIEVTIMQQEKNCLVKISDNGLGIPSERLEDVFNMFTQIDPHSTHTKGGLGIGLTLVHKLVALHHGFISVHSEGLGHGSEFTITLPLANDIEKEESSSKIQLQPTTGRKKVLFVDDNADIVEVYCLLCDTLGYETKGISDPLEAESVFISFVPDCVFLDIGMPDIDGYELCSILKKLPEAANTQFYAQSGWGSKKDIERALESGFTGHFVKPLSLDNLKSALEM